MRIIMMVVVVACWFVPFDAYAGEHTSQGSDLSPASASATIDAPLPPLVPTPGKRWNGCNLKGALVGAAIGAGLGLAASALCDGGECLRDDLLAIGFAAGFGAGIGCFADAHHRAPASPTRHLRLGALVRPRAGGVTARVSF